MFLRMECRGTIMNCIVLLLLAFANAAKDEDEPVKIPTMCEVCKFLVTELKELLGETDKSKAVIETGYGLETKKKRIQYQTSELRLTEALHEPHICDKILQYNVHAEKKGSNRYAKGMSETMQTLHGLVDKGVKVELGIPYELWDKPSAEVTDMHRKCVHMVEENEENIEDWYFHHQKDADLADYLCHNIVLKGKDNACMSEVPEKKGEKKVETEKKADTKPKKKSKKKDKLKGDIDLQEDEEVTVASQPSKQEL